jgi:hypothetical protein
VAVAFPTATHCRVFHSDPLSHCNHPVLSRSRCLIKKANLGGASVRARGALTGPKWRFPARAVAPGAGWDARAMGSWKMEGAAANELYGDGSPGRVFHYVQISTERAQRNIRS